MATEHMSETARQIGDGLSVITVVATLAQWLPAIAALFTIVWTLIRIFETDTVKKLLKRFK